MRWEEYGARLEEVISTERLSVTDIKERDLLAELVNEGNLVLKWTVKKYDWIMENELFYFRIGSSCGSL